MLVPISSADDPRIAPYRGVKERDLIRECYEASGALDALHPQAPALADPAYQNRLQDIAARMREQLRRPMWERVPGE